MGYDTVGSPFVPVPLFALHRNAPNEWKPIFALHWPIKKRYFALHRAALALHCIALLTQTPGISNTWISLYTHP